LNFGAENKKSMKPTSDRTAIFLTGVFIMTGLFQNLFAGEAAVRPPAVAGQFYPASPAELKRDIDKYLVAGAPKSPLPAVPRIIISPHAGYVYSGPVAGFGFAALGQGIKTVIVLGPPHHVPVRGIAAPGSAWFETPLGKVAVDQGRIKKLLQNSLVYEDAEAHASEHSIEVQLPFLQVKLGSFTLVPLLVGEVDPQKAADAIFPLIDDHTLVVASSDFSHYKSQKETRILDDRSIAAIIAGDINGRIDACGEMPIRVAMVLAKRMGLEPQILNARTSYDTYPERGSETRVVGYASVVFIPSQKVKQTVIPAAEKKEPADILTPEVKSFLLKLARTNLEKSVRGEFPDAPQDIPVMTKENSGCFVTLTEKGALRGCIGYIEPIKPLYRAVMENARNAALSDPRFPPVAPSELAGIKVEVSVLTRPVAIEYNGPQDLLDKLVPHVDGIILQDGPYQSTFLPQVWDQLPEKTGFLEALSLKGGMARDGWKKAHVKRYWVEHFSE
jgi:MEMO1 family protein